MTAVTQPLPNDPVASTRVALKERLWSNNLHLPVLPQIATEVMSLTNDMDTELSDLSKLIHRDQALATQVVRIANSAAYSRGETISSLDQAIGHVGLRLLNELTIAISVHGEVFRVPGYQLEVKYLWRQALASGSYAREIAIALRLDQESLFLCGLLHTVGKPITLKVLVELLHEKQIYLTRPAVLTLVDEFHCGVSELVATKWKLPQPVVQSAAHYLQPAEAKEFKTEAAVTQLAHTLADWIVNPATKNDPPGIENEAVLSLGLSADQLQKLIDRRDQVVATINSLDL